jgi:uncharacterized protein (TIGR02145 family)
MKKGKLLIHLLFSTVLLLAVVTACEKTDDPTDTEKEITCKDADGNVYKTVKIGTQVWMAENLKTTKYNDGTEIPNVTGNDEWHILSTGAYCNYNNADSNVATYGRLYNWDAVGTGKLAPAGWHVATDEDYTTLTTYLGGESAADGKLKESGTAHWVSTGKGVDNSSGFTALPGGFRWSDGKFDKICYYGCWWTSSVNEYGSAWGRFMYYIGYYDYRNLSTNRNGYSVRCVMD